MPRLLLAACLLTACFASALPADDAVPKGDVTKYSFDQSKIFPGTVRDYWVYVPKQYDPARPACVHVNQDGVQYKAPEVFDELIHKKEMPVTIGVFVMHGKVPAPNGEALDRFNRSYEYDGLGDAYARFILDEILPEVEKKTAPDGRPIHLSRDGNDRAIAGASSGAICAFTAAWERPDAFRRVYSTIGTYVGLRGGNVYPTLIRKYEPKPIRIFLQDGLNDNRGRRRGEYDPKWDWHAQNRKMVAALTEKKYDVNFTWGIGSHSNKQGGAIMPDMLRWLWRDYSRPDDPADDSNRKLFVPPEGAKPAAEQEP